MATTYLDHNATTPILPEVWEAMAAAPFGNPSSLHAQGQEARRALDRARAQVANLLGADPEEILFTSGGTEADNQALRALAPRRLVTSTIEHSAVLETARVMEQAGTTVVRVPVDAQGVVCLESLRMALQTPTDLVSLMLANNEVGTLQPIPEAAALARSMGATVHSDAVQAVGRVPVDVRRLGVDLLSLSAHKLGGPKGVGALFVRRSLAFAPWITGGPQERRLRGGTENLTGIVGFGVACTLARTRLEARATHTSHLRSRLEVALLAAIPGTRCHGHPEHRLPNTTCITFKGLTAEDLVLNLDLEGIAVAVGAACQSEARRPNPVLLAMGCSEAEARSGLRFSLGEDNTEAEVDRTVAVLTAVVARLRRQP